MNTNINSWDREKYLEAWYFASIKHTGQKYGGNQKDQQIEYLTHIGKVTMEIFWALSNSTTAYDADLAVQCAILHDTIEDTATTYEELAEKFGTNVADGVNALSKNPNLPTKELQMADSIERIIKQPHEIWMVKLADRISNLYLPPFYWDELKIKKYLAEARFIYDNLHKSNLLLAERLIEKMDSYMTHLKSQI